MRVYLAYSLTQEAPWPPSDLGYPYVLVSADEVARYGIERALDFFKEGDWPPPRLLVDSGAYRLISRGRLPDPEPVLEVQHILWEELRAYPVLLDVPVRSPLKATEADYKASNEATARNSRLWQRVFGDYYIYPLHACNPQTLREAVGLMKRTHPTVATVGLGSLAPLAARSPARVLDVIVEARRLLRDKWIHVFGVGNGMLAAISHWGLADSADTASHLVDARFGMARDPTTMSMKYVVPRGPPARRASPARVSVNCACPICRSDPQAMAEWGRRGFRARAVHNAYWILRAVAEPGTGVKLIGRRPSLTRALSKLKRRPGPTCIVSCGKKKRDQPAPASLLYTGRYFRALMSAAWSRCGSRILILSGEHGLLHPSTFLGPYEKKANPKDKALVERVRRQAVELGIDGERILVYAGRNYVEVIERAGQRTERAFGPTRIGQIMRSLKAEAENRIFPAYNSQIYQF